ncbi:MAG: lactate racemase domain-containing protein [Lentisphaerae bacterium]|nr:lactate racemase domain-containing protein [Lentisphaerota bacterium]
MMLYERGSVTDTLDDQALREGLYTALDRLGKRQRVVAVPPDITRLHSHAGDLTRHAHAYYGDGLIDVLPAVGTHSPMTDQQIAHMFAGVPRHLFRDHDWRNGVTDLGEVPAAFLRDVSGGAVDYAWKCQIANLLASRRHDLILSIGQVVPHEVVGMANHNKNLLIGTGGSEAIHKSHFLGAVYGMERMMGRADTPVRRVLNYATDHFLAGWPIVWVQTVVGRDARDGTLKVRGLFIGDGYECFERAAALALQVNFQMLDEPLRKVVVYLQPDEYKSTWLGNKSVYRTRMAIADGGELVVLAPGLREFGEDRAIDALIRRHGYLNTPGVLAAVQRDPELGNNLSAAAHLIHGTSEGRFTITYCPGHLTQREIESVHYRYADLPHMLKRYNPQQLVDGFNTLPDGERVFYISNPGLGLWAHRNRF